MSGLGQEEDDRIREYNDWRNMTGLGEHNGWRKMSGLGSTMAGGR